ncbi:uncharacterized protein L201_003704 [Kwoniella dendrophila CBS 6074]|uniref:Protein kinase domain-containing protein n=1 Tax=Kwoniella dendrophila CBS 6074 TaxID=1295534 RepID=A0AAX4JUB8_9TREE
MPKEEILHPGAGTLYVYGNGRTRGSSPIGRNSKSRSKGSKDRSSKYDSHITAGPPILKWDDLVKHTEDPITAAHPDYLLKHGITEYTYLPLSSGGLLGKGKFSTVYKVLGADGLYYALKHTPLHPHHPLISARLLREPTLLAELPSHPCLIGVEGWVRTQGHFYLVEQYASSHVPLPAHPLPLQPSRAAYILDQLVSVIRDTLHEKGRVCHRDLKGDNVLVDVETGEILILDLGLATRFSASEPKLTTCCGSPAFHSPEIVQALARPPGEVTYYGPELDIWCIALTMLSLLLQIKFPLGPKHTSLYVMRERARDRLSELDAMYPPHAPWRPPTSALSSEINLDFEKSEWARVRKAMRDFLEIDGNTRMAKFHSYELGEKIKQRVSDWDDKEQSRRFKSTSFIESEIKYTLPIYSDDQEDIEQYRIHTNDKKHKDKSKTKKDIIVLRNPMAESERRCKSYIKYLMRSAGIMYHLLPTAQMSSTASTPTPTANGSAVKEDTIFQLAMNVPLDMLSDDHSSSTNDPQVGWFPSLFSFGKKPPPINSASTSPQQRSVSLPPSKRSETPKAEHPAAAERDKSPRRALRCYIKVEFIHSPHMSPIGERRRGSVETFTSYRDGWGSMLSPLQPVTSLFDNHTTAKPSTTPSKNYTFPPRSTSVSKAAVNRPGNRRSVSHASTSLPRQPLTRIATTSSINNGYGLGYGVPASPLSKQISLSDSPPNDTIEPLPRPHSRASSRSRKSSLGYAFPSAHHSQQYYHNNGLLNSSHESKIIIHLSDPRAYGILKKAFNVQPNINGNTMKDLNLLSPTTFRRPSLAPSLTMSTRDPEPSQSESSEDDRERGIKIRKNKEEHRSVGEEQEERGRPRSKDDSTSMLQLQKMKSRNSTKSSKSSDSDPTKKSSLSPELNVNIKHDEIITKIKSATNGDIENHATRRFMDKRSSSKSRPHRGLLEVIFGNHNEDNDDVSKNSRRKVGNENNANGISGLGMSLGTGYGRAMRARSVPPYRSVDDLI